MALRGFLVAVSLGAQMMSAVAQDVRQNIPVPTCPPICVGQSQAQPVVGANGIVYFPAQSGQQLPGGVFPYGFGQTGFGQTGFGQTGVGQTFVVGPDGRLYPSQTQLGPRPPGQSEVTGLDGQGQRFGIDQRPPDVDPAVFQRGQSPFPGDGGRISVLNQGGPNAGIKNTLLRQEGRRQGIQDGYADFVEKVRVKSLATATPFSRRIPTPCGVRNDVVWAAL